MVQKQLILWLSIIFLVVTCSAQEKTEQSKPTAQLFGYVKAESHLDTRQIVGARDDHDLAFPEPRLFDPTGQDINSQEQLAIMAIQTTVGAELSGLRVLDADARGYIETDFRGVTEATINSLRLLKAFFELAWENHVFLFGQTFWPMVIPECYPGTYAFNAGAPIEAYAYNPQLQYCAHLSDRAHFFVAAGSELEARSFGPKGIRTEYIRNTVTPLLHVQFRYQGEHYLVGTGIDMRSLRPRIETSKGFATDERITSVSAIAFAKWERDSTNIKTKLLFTQNAAGYSMLGGYGVKSADPTTDRREYTNIRHISAWLDIAGGSKWEGGLFAGVSKNLGSSDKLADVIDVPGAFKRQDLVFGLGTDIDWMFRISPRFGWYKDPVRLGVEFEYTRAAFGDIQADATVSNTTSVGNFRLLLVGFYYF